MSEFVFKLPDLGEGMVEAEIVEWHVRPGDIVAEGNVVVDIMTDKANVEVPAAVSGTVLRTSGEPGDVVAVGAELIAFETTQTIDTEPAPLQAAPTPEPPPERTTQPTPEVTQSQSGVVSSHDKKIVTSPAVRRRAKEANIDLSTVTGTGRREDLLVPDPNLVALQFIGIVTGP